MMLHVDRVVHRLREAAADRLCDSKKAVHDFGTEKWIVNEIMADAVDVRVNHQRINEAEDQHHTERRVGIQKEQPEKVSEMKKSGGRGQHVPAGVRKNARARVGSVDADGLGVHGG